MMTDNVDEMTRTTTMTMVILTMRTGMITMTMVTTNDTTTMMVAEGIIFLSRRRYNILSHRRNTCMFSQHFIRNYIRL